jgi:hypothetical protein
MAQALDFDEELVARAKAEFSSYADDPFVVQVLDPQCASAKVVGLLLCALPSRSCVEAADRVRPLDLNRG